MLTCSRRVININTYATRFKCLYKTHTSYNKEQLHNVDIR